MRGTPKIVSIQFFLALLAMVLLNTGCLTHSLWRGEIREPARDPGLTLAVAPDRQDVLVQYNESQSDKVRHRSYWLFEYAEKGTGRPRFIHQQAYAGMDLIQIPLSEQGSEVDAEPADGYVAVATVEQRS